MNGFEKFLINENNKDRFIRISLGWLGCDSPLKSKLDSTEKQGKQPGLTEIWVSGRQKNLPSVIRDDALSQYPFFLYVELLLLVHCDKQLMDYYQVVQLRF